ncbi:glycosyltransferase family 39 protein [Sphingomonas radiodurans]|uniref:glycosyltransferase family 39 protein n=1 Tax=Sphingomonas radiodurans TaxID=2890321 RepID=UPI001E51A849|nr:glycosyltransferase family 39 protein [Sphingomonas radiodurans]WBH16623.1 glycosyltransferase family 39 protein [Sphingomonas radiodurans]
MTTMHHPGLRQGKTIRQQVPDTGERAVRQGRWLAIVTAAMVAALYLGWVGFIASDDSLYHAGALRWLTDPPFAGSDHWSTRFPLTLTFAGVLATVGQNYTAFGVTAVLFYVVLVVVTGRFAASVASPRAGWIAALLTATLPVVVSHSTTVSVDLTEAAALLAGALLLGRADDDRGGLLSAALGGALFGVAILCRETSVLALAALGPLFLLGRPFSRRVLLACAFGAAAVLLGEALFQYALTGDPLRRYTIAFNHDEHIDRAANREGNFLLWPPIDPVLVLLINDDFGLLFWLAGAAVAGGAWQMVGAVRRGPLTLLAWMAVASFVLVSGLYSKLVLNPRYFMAAALAAVVVLAVWLDHLNWRLRAAILTVVVGSNLLLMSVGNAHPRWAMEALVAAAQAHPGETVAGEASDVRRADLPMAFIGQRNLRAEPAAPGGLVVAAADAAPRGEVVARYLSPPTRLGGILRAVGLEPLVPAPIARRMFAPSPAMVLVRTPPG